MPVYNAAQYISNAIDSVLAQTNEDWELIIVNDGSTDTTKEIITAYTNKDTRIKYYYQENKKQAAARNLGMSQATGDWIGFLDADDLWHPEKLEVQVKLINTTEADVFYSGGSLVDENNHFIRDYPSEYGIFSGSQMYKMLYRYNPVPILSVLVKKSMTGKVGLMDESPHVVGCEDLDYWLRLAAAGASFYGIDKKLFSYRVNPSGTSRNIIHMHFAEKVTLTKNFNKEKFSIKEIRRLFKPSIVPLIVYYTQKGRLEEAIVLLKNVRKNVPLLSYNFIYILFKSFKKYALMPIRVINKLDSVIHNERYTSSIVSLNE